MVINSTPTDPLGPTGKLANWLVGLTIKDIPDEIIERAKFITLDGLGCALIGAKMPWSALAADIVQRFEGAGSYGVTGQKQGTSAPAAALLNGTFIQGFELDDYHPWGPLHSASVVLPAAFAAAQRQGGVNGEALLTAIIAGYEVGPRVGMALHGRQMLSRGWHSGAVFGTHAAVAAAGKVIELNAAQMEDALGLAGTQSAGLMAAQFEAMSKRMHHGFSARNGLYAAILAEGGYTGIKRVFERDYGGFLSTFGAGFDPDISQIDSGLGVDWETARIAIKPYAAMGALHAPIDAVFALSEQYELLPDQIEKITVDMSHSAFHHGGWQAQRPITVIGAQMNVAYAVAVAILDKAVLVDQFAASRLDDEDVWNLIGKIEARHNPDFDSLPGNRRQTAHMAIKFTDGRLAQITIPASRAVAKPLTNQEIIEKFLYLTQRVISSERQQKIISVVGGLEESANVNELFDVIFADVDAAFKIEAA